MLAELPTPRRPRAGLCAPAWAATTRPRSTRRWRRPWSRASTRRGEDFTLVSEELGIREGGADLGRARPDRRLDQREARAAVLLALGRGRRGRDDGRRRLRLRLRLRQRRGVDGGARRRRPPERRAARRRPAEGPDRAARARGDAHRPRRARTRRRSSASSHRLRIFGLARALALPPRRRPRRRGVLAEAAPARSTSPPRSCSSASAATRSSCPSDPPFGERAARPRGALTCRRRGNRELCAQFAARRRDLSA